MNSASDLRRLLHFESSLSTSNRQLRLRFAKSDLGGELLPQRVVGTESICGGIEFRVACLSASPDLPLKELIAVPTELQFVTDRGSIRSVCGIVTEARAGDFDGGLAIYHLVLRDALAIMEKRTNSRIFRYRNEFEIVQVLFDEWRHSNAVLATAFEYELDPLFDMREFPPREQTMQYNESDAAFVRRLLKRRGIAWYVRPGRCRSSAVEPVHDGVPAHTLVLFNNSLSLPANAAGKVRYHREDATDRRDVITSWVAVRSLQPGSATRHSWDYKNPSSRQFMVVNARSHANQGPNGNELAATLDDYLVETPHAGNDIEDHWRLGQLRLKRHDYATKCFYGEGTVRDFCAGEHFELTGHHEIDSHPKPEREFVITELELVARNNLPKDLCSRADRLLGGDRKLYDQNNGPSAAIALVQIRFKAVRRGIPIVPAFDPRVDLPHPELQSAIVVGPPNEEVHCDALGRVKIRFPGMRGEDHKHAHGAGASDSPADSAWVRVASNWAGNGPGSRAQCGTLSLPRVGSEVLVAFVGGDPDRPIIICQVFNQQGEPPALSRSGSLPRNRYLTGMKSREIGGQRANQLRFDDTRGQISAQLASDHAQSQLNLGFLTGVSGGGTSQQRGDGAELRSDSAVAVRGRGGVLITADASPADEGQQLSRAGLIGLAQLLQGVTDEVTRLAEQHAGDEESEHLADLVNKLKNWDSGPKGVPVIAVTAPAGILVASPESLALGSEKKATMASAGDAEVAAGKNIFVRAARTLSLFAHQLGVKLVAGRGDVTIQTHHGNVEIKASGRISLIAAEGIDLQAPEVKVVAKGCQTDWGEGDIVEQSTGQHVIKSNQFARVAPGGGLPVGLNLPKTEAPTDERVVLRHQQTRKPVPNQRYIAHLKDGMTVQGVTDEQGKTSIVKSSTMDQVRFELLPSDPST